MLDYQLFMTAILNGLDIEIRKIQTNKKINEP